ncbi:universal stress protein [Vibrio tetraodonis]|uniref:universal stress protein n=1 Tax=Vibrio tetraodonis TaxID=2231647 RepID=UPI000E0AE770|nr:universal stress protein [Vibrio tetraodonis]
MQYQHIMVALELSDDSNILIERAIFMAKQHNADISFIHLDGSHGEIYPELIDIHSDTNVRPVNELAMKKLRSFEANVDFPIRHFLVGTGNLANKLSETIENYRVDLLLCGHHQDFWSKILSYSRQLINRSPVDILVVPISGDDC